MTSIAVAVASGGNGKGSGSKRAVKWATENMVAHANRIILVHVMPNITHIPTPWGRPNDKKIKCPDHMSAAGDRVSIKELDANVITKYLKDVKLKCEQVFTQYKQVIKTDALEIETLVLEDDNPATGLLKYVSKAQVTSLVMGSQSVNFFWRKFKGPGISSTVLKCSPDFCDIFIVSKHRVITKLAVSLISSDAIAHTPRLSSSSLGDRRGGKTIGASSFSVAPSHSSSSAPSQSESQNNSFNDEFKAVKKIAQNRSSVAPKLNDQKYDPPSCPPTPPSEEEDELEQLKRELQTTLALYNRACDDLMQAQNQVQMLSTECMEEAEKINAATEREESLWKIAAEEKTRHLVAMKEAEEAKMLLAKEAYERQIAELNALKESSERMKVVDELISTDIGYRRYSARKIEEATDNFSESKVVGEGSYGKVYKGTLDHTPVAIKALQQDAAEKKEEFLKEVGILRKLRHPNIVLLLGACPENGCLVYEYMEHGSLEEHIFCIGERPPIPWYTRFRIAFEIACGLAFLHGSKPEPIVHRDLKPGNILLGRNYAAKISDVGLAKIISEAVPDAITQFGTSMLAGTLYYMDPEYQRTGTVRPKSDLYSFGIILLQLLTGRHPNGLLMVMENAIESGSLHYMLDTMITDWPLPEAEEMVKLALDCCKLRCRDRPDLETHILPTLKKLQEVATACMNVGERSTGGGAFAPKYYFCPILKEIMEDPYVAADGYTYERRAIEAWLAKHKVSPMTETRLSHFNLRPNKTLQKAIRDWKSRVASSYK